MLKNDLFIYIPYTVVLALKCIGKMNSCIPSTSYCTTLIVFRLGIWTHLYELKLCDSHSGF